MCAQTYEVCTSIKRIASKAKREKKKEDNGKLLKSLSIRVMGVGRA